MELNSGEAVVLQCRLPRVGEGQERALFGDGSCVVRAFLEGTIPLGRVPEILARVLEEHRLEPVESVEQLERVDALARAGAGAAAVAA